MKAFPTHKEEGMDLRDYFAARAMPLAMSWLERNYDRSIGTQWLWDGAEYENDAAEIAHFAYHIADAMMEARDKK
jgi:hypothetical protein